MAHRNRVHPNGQLLVTSARGTLMGNRGCLHNHQQEVVHDWQRKAWIICILEFKGQRRSIMSPGRYTELFFLDEATALAAGHRPCALCQRYRYNAFREAWESAYGEKPDSIKSVDGILHEERTRRASDGHLYNERLKKLPEGTMILTQQHGDQPHLLWDSKLYPWSERGYGTPINANPASSVQVITPATTVHLLQAGYQPDLHYSIPQ